MNRNKENNYSHDWIFKLEGKYHWALYWHQLNCVMNISRISKKDSIIEVGKGSGHTSNYLLQKGYSVTTADIDENKQPDIILDLMQDEIPKADAFLAFEIMEHIPYETVEKFIQSLNINRTRYFIFSLPYAFKSFLWLEGMGLKIGTFSFNIGTKRKKIISKHHFWELGINGHSVDSVKKMLLRNNYNTKADYKYRNHHFFVTELNQ